MKKYLLRLSVIIVFLNYILYFNLSFFHPFLSSVGNTGFVERISFYLSYNGIALPYFIRFSGLTALLSIILIAVDLKHDEKYFKNFIIILLLNIIYIGLYILLMARQ